MVRGKTSPPAADTRYSRRVAPVPNTITPSRFHVPPLPAKALATEIGGPQVISIFSSVERFAKKPIQRLSGDQHGNSAPSVPASERAARESKERTHKTSLPLEQGATKFT